jgi:hypothetical protein
LAKSNAAQRPASAWCAGWNCLDSRAMLHGYLTLWSSSIGTGGRHHSVRPRYVNVILARERWPSSKRLGRRSRDLDSSPVRYRVRRRLCGVMDGRRVAHHRDAALNGALAGIVMARPAPAMAVPTLGLVPKWNRKPRPARGLRKRSTEKPRTSEGTLRPSACHGDRGSLGHR